jgi:hypothetical protein
MSDYVSLISFFDIPAGLDSGSFTTLGAATVIG